VKSTCVPSTEVAVTSTWWLPWSSVPVHTVVAPTVAGRSWVQVIGAPNWSVSFWPTVAAGTLTLA
jgi:hypothetical protein